MDNSDPDNSEVTAQDERERRKRQRQDELVDLMSEQSFPASDPRRTGLERRPTTRDASDGHATRNGDRVMRH